MIQWDLPLEIAMLEHDAGRLQDPHFEPYFSSVKLGILYHLDRLAVAIDSDVEIGFHLCYGDINHTHFIQPEDMGKMVDFANNIIQSLKPIHTVMFKCVFQKTGLMSSISSHW